MAASFLRDRATPPLPVPFRPVDDEMGLLLAQPLPMASPGGIEATWVKRARALFDPGFSGLVANYFANPQACVELRLCGGAASEVDWGAYVALAERVRVGAPECVLRVEVWCDEGSPAEPPPDLLKRLRALRPLFVHPWVEREADLTPVVKTAWARLLDSGIPMATEVLLRRGTLDTADALRSLCLKLVEWRARPQALIDGAWLPADERVAPDVALECVRGLRGWISGLAAPQLMEESATGRRSVRVPPYVVSLNDAGADLVSYAGQHHHYPNPPEE